MPRGNPSPKIAITVDPDVHRAIVTAAEAEGVSLSAWLTKAARHRIRTLDGLAAMREWEAEEGPVSDDEREESRRRVHAQLLGTSELSPA